jgi:hypothetical protein
LIILRYGISSARRAVTIGFSFALKHARDTHTTVGAGTFPGVAGVERCVGVDDGLRPVLVDRVGRRQVRSHLHRDDLLRARVSDSPRAPTTAWARNRSVGQRTLPRADTPLSVRPDRL